MFGRVVKYATVLCDYQDKNAEDAQWPWDIELSLFCNTTSMNHDHACIL